MVVLTGSFFIRGFKPEVQHREHLTREALNYGTGSVSDRTQETHLSGSAPRTVEMIALEFSGPGSRSSKVRFGECGR